MDLFKSRKCFVLKVFDSFYDQLLRRFQPYLDIVFDKVGLSGVQFLDVVAKRPPNEFRFELVMGGMSL